VILEPDGLNGNDDFIVDMISDFIAKHAGRSGNIFLE